jgi:C4-dicarboxylate-specific signal transduction histidine kinase
MVSQQLARRGFLRMSLSTRLTILLILASLLPLLTIVISSQAQSRPVLTDQASKTLGSDAQTHVELFEQFFNEQFALADTVSQDPIIQEYLSGQLAVPAEAQNVLLEVYRTNTFFQGVALFDPHGRLLLSSPNVPEKHGKYLFPPDDLKQIIAHPLTLVSPVFYDPTSGKVSVDLYVPVQTVSNKVLGIVRITLDIDYIQELVSAEQGANGNGSYAFLVDQFGVRIADTNPARRFTAIAPLSTQEQQLVQSEAIYGDTGPVKVEPDPALASIQNSAHPPLSFQMQPAGQKESFQVTRIGLSVVPWTYFVLAPLSSVTAVANQQLQTIAEIAFLVLLLAVGFGLLIGRSIARPLLSAVDALSTNNNALSDLSEKQRAMANEEEWIVDGSQMALRSVDYYTEATHTAVQSLRTMSTELLQDWRRMPPEQVQKGLQQMHATTQYIEKAAGFQLSSREQLMTAIRVMKQVNEQLAAGATAAADAATQEEKVVKQLQDIVGQ